MARNIAIRLAWKGNLRQSFTAWHNAGKRSVKAIVKNKTELVKRKWRRTIVQRGLSVRLSRGIQSSVQPKRQTSFDASGVVYDKSFITGKGRRTPRPGGAVSLIQTLNAGATIRASRSRFLAIPTKTAQQIQGVSRKSSPGRFRPSSVQPQDFVRGSLLFLDNPPRLVLKERPEVILFILKKSARIKPRAFNFEGSFRSATANMDTLMARRWDREAQKAIQKIQRKFL